MANQAKIVIVRNGPYQVTGNVAISEKIITPNGRQYELKEGQPLPQAESYALCRCGKTKTPPFCDGSHLHTHFDGEETASKANYLDRLVDVQQGPELDLLDDGRCAFARFCHRNTGSVWELIANSDDPALKKEAMIAASECPSGRLVAFDKEGNQIEKEYAPAIFILQDPQKKVSGPIAVVGRIPIESANGVPYEVRNRVALCRCGESSISPFCDASHINAEYKDK